MSNSLHPLMSNKFLVEFKTSSITSSQGKLLTHQVTNVEMDLVNKRVTVKLQQPVGVGSLVESVVKLNRNKVRLVVHFMDGNETSWSRLFFDSLVEEHTFVLDYANGGAAEHKLVFSYNEVNADNSHVTFGV